MEILNFHARINTLEPAALLWRNLYLYNTAFLFAVKFFIDKKFCQFVASNRLIYQLYYFSILFINTLK